MGQAVLIYIDAQLAELQEIQPIHWYLHKKHRVRSKCHIHTHSKVTAVEKKKKINNFFPLFSVIENGSDTSTLTWIRIFVRLICTQIYFFFHVNPVSFVALSGNIFTFVSRQKISIQNMIVILTGEGVRLINKTTTLLLFWWTNEHRINSRK